MSKDEAAPLADITRGAPRSALAALCDRVYPRYRIARIRCLRGGVDAATHRVDLQPPDGDDNGAALQSIVVRRYGKATLRWNPDGPLRLWYTLHALNEARLGVATPKPLLFDTTTLHAPTLLMSYLPGRSTLQPRDLSRFLVDLAQALARIHRVPSELPILAHLPCPAERLSQLFSIAAQHPGLNAIPDGAAIRRVLSDAPHKSLLGRPVLLHGDYWAGNVVWLDSRLHAILDWDQAERGDSAYDVAYCRADLALMFGSPAADEFLQAYEDAAQTSLQALGTWDLLAATRALPSGKAWLPGYLALGRSDLSEPLLQSRLQTFLHEALRRALAS
ncbi:MAG: aminoglycoside phosphotransferase family protein [Myxococcales bacterium]|nr:aminoglycoside phosphotransferase family protein [Myxococcales bacterium]